MRRFIAVAASILILVSGQRLYADWLFDNGAAVEQDLGIRYNYSGWSVFDDFVLGADSLVTGFQWTQFDEAATSYASTTLLLFNDLPRPSSLVLALDVTANRTSNGMMLNTDKAASGQVFGIDYTVSGESIALSAGTYFLGIHNDVSGGATLIAKSLGGNDAIYGFYQHNAYYDDPSVFGLTESGPNHWNNGYTAFRVEGTAVPAPSSLACLVGVGLLVGLNELRKKRRLERRAQATA